MRVDLINNKYICCKDPIYKSVLLYIFANRLIRNGKKSLAYRILYSVLHEIRLEIRDLSVAILENAVRIIIPSIQLKALRISGAIYQVPIDVKLNVGISVAIQWILNASSDRNRNSIVFQLLDEIIQAASGLGSAIRKRREVCRIAEANKAFVRYRLKAFIKII
uniref:Ribosomal protein S7 n=1 Tax=Lepidodinium chlorophorum TaxID=107758 RepID=A0A0F7QZV9_LEPCH|nr:ribosomal protein S7 [Lepidodinium chlorophorum]BAR72351.1 ribosomal protein S7 [Lepidodinium chlorophorum]